MYQNYIFDFYGTLADITTNEESAYLWNKMAQIYSAYGAAYKGTELKKTFRGLCAKQEEELVRKARQEEEPGQKAKKAACVSEGKESAAEVNAEIDLTECFLQCFTEKGVSSDREKARMMAITFRTLSRKYLRAYSGVYELLEHLKASGKKIYLLSNAQTDFTRPEITALGIDKYLDGIFISSEVGFKKPAKEFYQKLLDTYKLDPKESIMIGNDIKADIEGARAVGLNTLYIHSNISPWEDEDREDTDIGATYTVWDGDFTKIKGLICQ